MHLTVQITGKLHEHFYIFDDLFPCISLKSDMKITFYVYLSCVSVKRHFKILRLAIKSNLKGFSHFFFFFWWNAFYIRLIPPWNLMILVFIFEIISLKLDTRLTSALSSNHKSTRFVIFRFYSFNQFLLKGNTSCFEIHSFWRKKLKNISNIFQLKIRIPTSACKYIARLFIFIHGKYISK